MSNPSLSCANRDLTQNRPMCSIAPIHADEVTMNANARTQRRRFDSYPCIPKLSASERGVDAASLSLFPQLSLNSNLVGSFTLKQPDRRRAAKSEGRAPTNWQFLDTPVAIARLLTLPLERGRSPPAARCSVEVGWSIPESFHQLCCCGPGRSAVRRWRFKALVFRSTAP